MPDCVTVQQLHTTAPDSRSILGCASPAHRATHTRPTATAATATVTRARPVARRRRTISPAPPHPAAPSVRRTPTAAHTSTALATLPLYLMMPCAVDYLTRGLAVPTSRGADTQNGGKSGGGYSYYVRSCPLVNSSALFSRTLAPAGAAPLVG